MRHLYQGAKKYMLRLMIKLGFHGKAHKAADAKVFKWMHDNGVGV